MVQNIEAKFYFPQLVQLVLILITFGNKAIRDNEGITMITELIPIDNNRALKLYSTILCENKKL